MDDPFISSETFDLICFAGLRFIMLYYFIFISIGIEKVKDKDGRVLDLVNLSYVHSLMSNVRIYVQQ